MIAIVTKIINILRNLLLVYNHKLMDYKVVKRWHLLKNWKYGSKINVNHKVFGSVVKKGSNSIESSIKLNESNLKQIGVNKIENRKKYLNNYAQNYSKKVKSIINDTGYCSVIGSEIYDIVKM